MKTIKFIFLTGLFLISVINVFLGIKYNITFFITLSIAFAQLLMLYSFFFCYEKLNEIIKEVNKYKNNK